MCCDAQDSQVFRTRRWLLYDLPMPMFLCRWPNGDFTIVEADDEDHAIELLDEWENADSAVIIPMVDCMFNFRLNDGGDIELQEIGADTQEFIRETCYPELEKVINDVREKDGDVYTPESIERIRAAVEHERTRQDVVTPEPAETEMGKDLQRGMDMARVTANRAVQREGARILDFIKTDPKKIQ